LRRFELALLAPGVRADPYPLYREMRDRTPVVRTTSGAWVLTRYADVKEFLRHPHARGEVPKYPGDGEASAPGPVERLQACWLPFLNGDRHRRLRRLITEILGSPASTEAVSAIEGVADEVVGGLPTNEAFDVIEHVAERVPTLVMCRLLGVEEGDIHSVERWSRSLVRTLEPMLGGARGVHAEALDAHRYLRRRFDPGSDCPRDDFVSALSRAGGGHGLEVDEMVSLAAMVFGAGHHTSRNLVGNGLLALVRHERWWRVHEAGGLRDAHVEELLRFESPVQITVRRTSGRLDLGDAVIPDGALVLGVVGSANRDPRAFDLPDRLELDRTPNQHLAFGAGRHSCLGAAIGKAVGTATISALARRHPSLTVLEDHPRWQATINFRGLKRLMVRVS
jgi:cytochrome P450